MSGRHRPTPSRHRAVKARTHWSTRTRVAVAVLDVLLVSGAAIAVTNWTVGLDSNSSAQGQSATISNLVITATASPTPSNLLYPGGTGDVVLTISNPNPFPVTITAVNLPTNTTYGAAFSDSGLSSAVAGCSAATPSLVSWNYATGSSGSSHTLTTPLTVAANGGGGNPLTVTLTAAASMGNSAPLACAASYFKMPSFTGLSATGGAAVATSSPATSSWTS